MDHGAIRDLESLGHRAWLAEEKMRLGGWLLRADHGVTRRANSLLPLDSPGLPLSIAINSVVEFYECRNLTPRFQMSEASLPPDLDAELEKNGFTLGLQVDVWTAQLSSLTSVKSTHEIELLSDASDEWIGTYRKASGHDFSTIDIRLAIMNRTQQSRVFAEAKLDGMVAATGYGVVETPWLGIFSVATHPDMRLRGAATAVSKELGVWAKQQGAEHAYLQVETNNNAAKSLYKKLGFKHAYRYWYRDLVKGKESECRSC